MNNLKREDLVSFGAVIGLYAALYLFNNNFQFFSVTTVPTTFVDSMVEFAPHWIYIYLAAYLLPVSMFFNLVRYNLHRKYTENFFILTLISNIIFFLFPSTIERPDFNLAGLDSLTHFAFVELFSTDLPFNCLPSTHVSTTLLAVLVTNRRPRSNFVAWMAWILVSYSALAIGQHYFLDALAGAFTACASYWLHPFIFTSSGPIESNDSRWSKLILFPSSLRGKIKAHTIINKL